MKIQLGKINNILKHIGIAIKITHPRDNDDPTPTDIIIRSRSAYEREVRHNIHENMRNGKTK